MNKDDKSVNLLEVILVIVVAVLISYIFYIELRNNYAKISELEQKISILQNDVVTLKTKIERLSSQMQYQLPSLNQSETNAVDSEE
ncbi:MAG: hypothetical protein PHG23_03865 [Candidatus Pacebacteria bacterium]|nr:hypothetical protein [Candidatus Paceibacterota bacterium]